MRRQTQAQILGRAGERWFQGVLPPEWLFNLPSEDFGIDGTVAIGDRNSITPFEFGVQIKTSQHWAEREGHVVALPVPVETLRYWAARLLPTLLVLYEEETGLGYYAWVPQLLTGAQFADEAKRTVSMRIPQSQRVDSACWQQIEDQAIAYHTQLASAFKTVESMRAVLGTIHSLAVALRILSFMPAPGDPLADQSLRISIEAAAHREVILALRAFTSQLPPSNDLRLKLEGAADAYRSMCSDFLYPFDDLLGSQEPIAMWASSEGLRDARPRLVGILADLAAGLSAIASRDVS